MIPTPTEHIHHPFEYKRLFSFFGVVAIGIITFWISRSRMEAPAAYMLAILVTAVLLWLFEIIPLFATSLLVIGAQIIFLANPGEWTVLKNEDATPIPFREFLTPLSDPIIILFLGGFILARVGVKVGVDRYISSAILRVFGGSPKLVLIGTILSTSLFGMWISNTATTAMMIALISTFLASVPAGNSFRKAIILAIPFSAGIGGLMTPISSPPNAIAVSLLANEGVNVSFLSWMLFMSPLVLVLLFILYRILWYMYKPKEKILFAPIEVTPFTNQGWFVIVIFFITVALWLTDSIHRIPAAVVALFPVIIFTATKLLSAKDFNRLEWNILFVIAGGIALSQGMGLTGLDKVIADMLPVQSNCIVVIMFVLTLLIGTFMSNTTTALLFIPMAITMAQVMGDVNLKFVAIGLAVMAGSSMALPISTPPNAIAYSTGELSRRDFAISGILIGLCSLVISYGYFWLLSYFEMW